MGYNTGKRERILAFLCENADSSYSLEEICSALTADGKGKSTVYRIVSELVAEGCLRRLSDGRTRHCTISTLETSTVITIFTLSVRAAADSYTLTRGSRVILSAR